MPFPNDTGEGSEVSREGFSAMTRNTEQFTDTEGETMSTSVENYCIDCQRVARADCDARGHIVGTLGSAAEESQPAQDHAEDRSPREVAQLFLDKWEIYASPLDAVELLIKARDLRAAKIADERGAFNRRMATTYPIGNPMKHLKITRADEAEIIANEIRGKSNG
jgi:hypothetical protein